MPAAASIASTSITAFLAMSPIASPPRCDAPVAVAGTFVPDSARAFDAAVRRQLQYGAIRAQLEQWATLPDDWDGEDGIPPPRSVVTSAISILGEVERGGIRAPTPMVAGDGEISLLWNLDHAFASISVLADGYVVGFARSGDQVLMRVDEPVETADISMLVKAIYQVV